MKAVPKIFGVAAAAAAMVAFSAPLASAAQPDKYAFEFSNTFTETSLCGFPIELSFQASGFETDFFNSAGDLIRIQLHITEQDTFTANGTTLVGDSYTGLQVLKFTTTNGEPELSSYTISGQLEKVRLPDGSISMGAGRTDVLAQDFGFIVAPDHGVAKNQDSFCAALSG